MWYCIKHPFLNICGALFLCPSEHARPDRLFRQRRFWQKVWNCAIDLLIVSKNSAEGRCEDPDIKKGPFAPWWRNGLWVCWTKQARLCLFGRGTALVSPAILCPESLIKHKDAPAQSLLLENDLFAGLELVLFPGVFWTLHLQVRPPLWTTRSQAEERLSKMQLLQLLFIAVSVFPGMARADSWPVWIFPLQQFEVMLPSRLKN